MNDINYLQSRLDEIEDMYSCLVSEYSNLKEDLDFIRGERNRARIKSDFLQAQKAELVAALEKVAEMNHGAMCEHSVNIALEAIERVKTST